MPTIVAYIHAYVPEHNAGAETTMHDLLKCLVKAGWEAVVVIKPPLSGVGSIDLIQDYVIDGVHVVQSRSKKTLLHYVARADITISHLECSERTHLMSNDYKIPTIHLVHNTHRLTQRWMQHSDALLINTKWISEFEGFKTFDKPKLVINPPVNPDEYKTKHGKSITLVNLWEDKGAEIFYEMAKRFPQLPFLGVKGGYGVQEIRELSNVTILEHTKDMREVYGQTKVILMPSKYESFGRVAVEALASGIPTIAEPTPGLSEALGSAGIFADRESPDMWESALRDVLKPAKYGKQSKLCLARSEELANQREFQLNMLPMFLAEVIRVHGKS